MPSPPAARPPQLQGVEHTLYLPMIVRAQAALLCPWMDPHDQYARNMLAQTGPIVFAYPTDPATVINILWRTQKIRQIGLDFFERFAHVQGINLGAGLANYFQWLDTGLNHWLDVDLPEVVMLRTQLTPEPVARHEVLADDLRIPGWWERLGLPQQGHHHPLLLIAEGLLMYMRPTEVKAFFEEIGRHAPEGSELLCDFISPLGIGHPSPANRQLSGEAVAFTWGAHNGQEIAGFHARLELLDQHSVCEAWGWCGSWLEMLYSPMTGGPMYGLAHLKISDDL
ncbi:MAG: class I SAM-dependent methyltransferase [Limnohabitans sp.]|nr:MAG: class I SAM-dependent methyltransferase [Limnohabitans sp.]